MNHIHIDYPERRSSCTVHIGTGGLEQIGKTASQVSPAVQAVVVCDSAIEATHGRVVVKLMQEAGYTTKCASIESTEFEKNLNTVHQLYRVFFQAGLDRESPVVAVGGGVIGDTAGFAAATYLRGLPLIHVPTTLLAMVDASIGGKTAVHLDLRPDETPKKPQHESTDRLQEGFGKNLIGAFHQPSLVVMDPIVLQTLPIRQIRAGLAECIKHAIIADPDLFTWLEARADRLSSAEISEDEWVELITRNVRIKANIVQQDERDKGIRNTLNLGHTFAHAIETVLDFDVQHGEAVGLGLIASAVAGVHMNRTDPALVKRIATLVSRIGLPTCLPSDSTNREQRLAAMRIDKKARSGRIRLIIPERVGSVIAQDSTPLDAINAGWSHIETREK